MLTDLASIAAGLGMVAAAAVTVLAARQRGPRPDIAPGARSLNELLGKTRSRRHKPPEAGLAVPAVPQRGPLPMQGGAAAPLDFDV